MSTIKVSNIQDIANNAAMSISSGVVTFPKTPVGAGKVLQVKFISRATAIQTQSTTYVTTGLTLSITPSSTSSKILIRFNVPSYINANNYHMYITLFRGTVSGTNLATSPSVDFGHLSTVSGGEVHGMLSGEFLDSPSTTSSVTYTIGYKVNTGAAVAGVFRDSIQGGITLTEIGG